MNFLFEDVLVQKSLILKNSFKKERLAQDDALESIRETLDKIEVKTLRDDLKLDWFCVHT